MSNCPKCGRSTTEGNLDERCFAERTQNMHDKAGCLAAATYRHGLVAKDAELASLRTELASLTASLKKSTDTIAGFDATLKYRSDMIAEQMEMIASLERSLIDATRAYSTEVARLTVGLVRTDLTQ